MPAHVNMKQAFFLAFKSAGKFRPRLYFPLFFQTVFSNQRINDLLAMIPHDLTEYHATGISVIATTETGVHGYEFMGFFESHQLFNFKVWAFLSNHNTF